MLIKIDSQEIPIKLNTEKLYGRKYSIKEGFKSIICLKNIAK